jgi:hypothetical protein
VAFSSGAVADPDRGAPDTAHDAEDGTPTEVKPGSAEEKTAREATTPEPLDLVRSCGPALFAVPTEPPPTRSVTESTTRNATVSERCRAYSSLVRCAERPTATKRRADTRRGWHIRWLAERIRDAHAELRRIALISAVEVVPRVLSWLSGQTNAVPEPVS